MIYSTTLTYSINKTLLKMIKKMKQKFKETKMN